MMTRNAFDLVAGVPWLITEEGLEQVVAIAAREHPDIEAVERLVAAREASPEALALRGAPRLEGTQSVSLRDGVAIVPVVGPIFRYANLMTMLSGATSTQLLARDFQLALDSPEVRAILLNVDSPGGQAAGISELAGVIRAGRDAKPIVAYAGDMMASAAYWLGSSAREIVLSSTALIGSIGAVMIGSDTATRDAQQGLRRIKVASALSPRKALDPSSRDGQAEIQDLVDALAERFVADVALNRGVTPAQVIADFGQGGLVPRPQEAIARGMADRLGSFESLIAELAAARPARSFVSAAAAAGRQPTMDSFASAAALAAAYPEFAGQIRAAAASAAIAALTAGTIIAEHPAIAEALRAEGRAGGHETAIAGERERIAKIMARTLPGNVELRGRAISSGMAYGDFLEAQTAAEQEKGGRQLARLRADEKDLPKLGADPTGELAAAAAAAAGAAAPDKSAPLEDRCKAEWDKSAALRGEFGDNYGSFLAYRKAEEKGQVRRLTGSAAA